MPLKKVPLTMLHFLVGFVALLAFLVIPYRIYQAHKEGDAEFGDYAFMLFWR